jgi:hypothetical protein
MSMDQILADELRRCFAGLVVGISWLVVGVGCLAHHLLGTAEQTDLMEDLGPLRFAVDPAGHVQTGAALAAGSLGCC